MVLSNEENDALTSSDNLALTGTYPRSTMISSRQKHFKLLEELPVEVQLLVFGSITDLRDAHQLLKASSVFRGTYAAHRLEVLNGILQTDFRPALLPEMKIWDESSRFSDLLQCPAVLWPAIKDFR